VVGTRDGSNTRQYGIVRYKLKSKLKVPHSRSIEAQPHVQNFKNSPHFASDDQLLGTGRQVFCEDESRFGLKTLLSRVITLWALNP